MSGEDCWGRHGIGSREIIAWKYRGFLGGGGGGMTPGKPRFLGNMYFMGPGSQRFLVFSDGIPEHLWADEKPKSEKTLRPKNVRVSK